MSMTDDRPRAPRGMPGGMSSSGGKADKARTAITFVWHLFLFVAIPVTVGWWAHTRIAPQLGGSVAIGWIAAVIAGGAVWALQRAVENAGVRLADSRARRRR